jgi:hypothetical protein
MAGEARKMWKAFITDPKNAHLLKRYAKSAKEPAALFDNIGEDLSSSNQAVREQAFWALVAAMPVLTSILYERETREPGWRDRRGKDQHMINQGADIVSYLHRKLVVEHRFKIRGESGKDPRPLVNRIAQNWQKDGEKKSRREEPSDDEDALELPDPAGAVEDIVLRNRELDDIEKEFLSLEIYRSEKERSLFRTVYIDHTPLAEAAESNGISSEVNLRQQFSRARKHAVAERDALFSFMLIGGRSFPEMGEISHAYLRPEVYELGRELAKRAVRPRAWLNGVPADGNNKIAVRPLTGSLEDAPGHIYLVAIRKDYLGKSDSLSKKDSKYVRMLIDQARGKLQKNSHVCSILNAYPTELQHLNEALAAVRDGYSTWLISTSVPDAHRIHRWIDRETPLALFLRRYKIDTLYTIDTLEILDGERKDLEEILAQVRMAEESYLNGL